MPYVIVKDSGFIFSKMDFLSYEETVPLLKATYFDNFLQLSTQDIHALIDELPDDPYGGLPDTVDLQQEADRGPKGDKLTPRELSKLKPAAKALLMSDERKACGIAKFVKETCYRELNPVKNEDDTKNCAYQAILDQISNIEYVFNTETGEPVSATDLRDNVVYKMTICAGEIYPLLLEWNVLPTSYKMWLHKQLDTSTPADEVSMIGLRFFLNVSNFLVY